MAGLASGLGFKSSLSDEERKLAAWANSIPYSLGLLDEIRIDCDGRKIAWSDYGKYSELGWQIDHILPSALGGSDSAFNLRARHWLGNTSAGGLLGNLFAQIKAP